MSDGLNFTATAVEVYPRNNDTKRQGPGERSCDEDYPTVEGIAAPHWRRHKDALCLQGGFEASWFK